jgi:YHS domain-containing protein
MLQHDAIELVETMDPKKQIDVAGSAAATDPVCGMSVRPPSAAGSFEYKGETYYFCSPHCLQRFREHPEQFLNKPTEPTVSRPVVVSIAVMFSLVSDI